MPIIFLNFRKSGNRGSDKITRPTNSSEVTQVVAPTSFVPQQSSRLFVVPTTGAVKKSISIKTVLEDPQPQTPIVVQSISSAEPSIQTQPITVEPQEDAQVNETKIIPIEEKTLGDDKSLVEDLSKPTEMPVVEVFNSFEEKPPIAEIETSRAIQVVEANPIIENKTIVEEVVDLAQEESVETVNKLNADFLSPWLAVVELLFNKTPAVYATLKTRIPEINNNIVVINTANSYQKDLITARQGEILHYLKENYSISLENIEIVADQLPDTKLVVMGNIEKLNELKRQNNSLPDFLEILNLNFKD